ncbi:hypothetical protein PanWU01x14_233680 [Parasponia andersonii]|uniref:Uncharacterized protein n=1 Tax=Parasponia andersonii TaxID=3476 RepID=A0A2P5BJJ9_PARAD|nr:hypothetical protein PanWU01x14_233680 [Parasponia andersonii]
MAQSSMSLVAAEGRRWKRPLVRRWEWSCLRWEWERERELHLCNRESKWAIPWETPILQQAQNLKCSLMATLIQIRARKEEIPNHYLTSTVGLSIFVQRATWRPGVCLGNSSWCDMVM